MQSNFIVKSNNPYAMLEKKNFFRGLEEGGHFNYSSSLDELKELVASNEMGTVYFTMNSDHIPKI